MDQTGYYWQGARYYDPVAGRFLSPDPLGHEASMDLYSYANGDPINFMDPDGRFGKGALWSGWSALEGTADLAQNVVGSGLYGLMRGADALLGGNDASLFQQYWDNTKGIGAGLAGAAENLGGAGGYWMLRGMDSFSGGNEAQPMQQYWNNVQRMGIGATGGEGRSAAFRWGAGLFAVGSMFVGGEFGAMGKVERLGGVAAESRIPQFIYRTGSQTENALTDAAGVSFRNSISSSANRAQVFDPGAKIWAVDTAKLPPGSVVLDGNPAGHVSVLATPSEIRAAIIPQSPVNPLSNFGLKLLEDGTSYRIPKR